MSNWQNSTFRQTSGRLDLEGLRKRVAGKAALAGEPGWWGCIEYFDRVETWAPARVADELSDDVSGLTLAWPGGNLRADRTQGGFWVTEIELGSGDTPCRSRQSQVLVWGKALGTANGRTRFGEGRVKSFHLPIQVGPGTKARVTASRVAVQDPGTGAWHDHGTVLGKIEPEGGNQP